MKSLIKTFSGILTDRYLDSNILYHNPITIDGVGYTVIRSLGDIAPARIHICKIGAADVDLIFEDYDDIIWDIKFKYEDLLSKYPPTPGLITRGKLTTGYLELVHESTPWTKGSHHITIHLS